MPGSASLPATERAILIVIDGLTPAMFEEAVEKRSAPALAELYERGEYRRAASVFPSLTPVCLSSLVTGAYPDVHRIPHLVWYHRGERSSTGRRSRRFAVQAHAAGSATRSSA